METKDSQKDNGPTGTIGPTGTNNNPKIGITGTTGINNNIRTGATGTNNSGTGTTGATGSNNSGTGATGSNNSGTGATGTKNNSGTGATGTKNNSGTGATGSNNSGTGATGSNNSGTGATGSNNSGTGAKGNNNSSAKEDLPFYHYTQSKFWGGPTTNWTILRVLSIFPLTGLLGLDHIYLRSPFSALLKTIFNILTLGLWYFYDMAQVLSEPERVKKFGMSYPIVGPVGLGAGIFLPDEEEDGANNKEKKNGGNGNDKEDKPSPPSPLTFLLYCIFAILPLPFALDHFVVGDVKGGIAKVFANFNIFLFIFSIFWTLFTLFRMTFQTEKMMKEGIIRFFPFTLFMEPLYCPGTKLGPKEECEVEPVSGSMSFMDFFKSIFATLRGIPVLGGIMGAVDKLKEVYDQYVPPVIGAGVAIATLAPKVAVGVTQKLAELGDTDKIMDQAKKESGTPAAPAANSQKGGYQPQQQKNDGPVTLFLLIAFAAIAFIGVFLAKLRDMEVLDVLPKSIHSIIRRRISPSTIWTPAGPNDTPPESAAI